MSPIENALQRHRQEGTRLAVKARLIALAAIMVLMPFLNPSWSVLYYEAGTLLLAAVAFLQLKLVHKNRVSIEILLFTADFAILTYLLLVPNPFAPIDKPLPAQFRLVEFGYYFLYLALGTLAYSWRAIRYIAIIGSITWLVGICGIWWFAEPHPSGPLVKEALKDYAVLQYHLDPDSLRLDTRIREVVIFALVAFILSVTVKRFGDLLQTHVSVEREHVNRSRYFSPNMIDELSANDEPLRDIRIQDVAVPSFIASSAENAGADAKATKAAIRIFLKSIVLLPKVFC